MLGVFQSECMHIVLTDVNKINIGCSLVSGVYSKSIKLYENWWWYIQFEGRGGKVQVGDAQQASTSWTPVQIWNGGLLIALLSVKFKFQTLSHLSSTLVNICVEIFFGIKISDYRQKHLEATQIH